MIDLDWTPEDPEDDDAFTIYRQGPDRVPMNPTWEAFWEDDPIFRCLCRDTGLEPDELVALLLNRPE